MPPTRHRCSLWWKEGGTAWPELCQPSEMVLSNVSGVVKVKFNSVPNDCLGQWEWLDLFCRNIYNTLHSDVLILPYKFPMITSSKRRESFSWDMTAHRVPPFSCEEGLRVSLIRNTVLSPAKHLCGAAHQLNSTKPMLGQNRSSLW